MFAALIRTYFILSSTQLPTLTYYIIYRIIFKIIRINKFITSWKPSMGSTSRRKKVSRRCSRCCLIFIYLFIFFLTYWAQNIAHNYIYMPIWGHYGAYQLCFMTNFDQHFYSVTLKRVFIITRKHDFNKAFVYKLACFVCDLNYQHFFEK